MLKLYKISEFWKKWDENCQNGCCRLIKVLKHYSNQELRTCAHLGAVEPVDGCLVCGGHLAVPGVDGDAGLLLDGGEALTTNQRSVSTMMWTNERAVSTEWTNERAVLPAAA